MTEFKHNISRRDFLKMGCACIVGLPFAQLNRALGLEVPEASSGIDFDLDLAPNQKLISFAVDNMLIINSFRSSGGQNFEETVYQGLAQKGYYSIAQTDGVSRALHLLGMDYRKSGDTAGTLGWGQLLAATGRQMYGAPVFLSIGSDALGTVRYLLGQKDGDQIGADGKVVSFGGGLPGIDQLVPGDLVFVKSAIPGFERGQELVILARAHKLGSGEPVILGSYIDSTTGVKGGVSIEWMTQDRFNEFTGMDSLAVAVRSGEMYSLLAENKERLRQYDGVNKQITRGYLDSVKPENVALLLSVIVVKGISMPVTTQERDIWINEQLKRLQFVNDVNSKIWVGNRAFYDKQAFGLAKAMLFQDLFPRDSYNDLYTDIIHKPLDILSFIVNMRSNKLSVSDLVANPEKVPIDGGLTWFAPRSVGGLAFGDNVVVGERQGLSRSEVGVVTASEINPAGGIANIMFFDWKGSGLPREVTIQNFSDLKAILGGSEVGIGILRSKEIGDMKFVEAMRNRYILDSSDIPREIRTGVLGMDVDYRSIPQFRILQNRLVAAKTLRERGEIIMQVAALMGVQTRDGAEKNMPGYQWNVYRKEDMCNLYSTSYLRALGLDKYISHWVLEDGTPAFNTGSELSATGMNFWMTKYGAQYGWFPVTRMSKHERLNLLKKGYVMYGAVAGEFGDTFVIYGIEGNNGEVIPVLTKATWNFMSTYPYRKYHFTDPMDYFNLHPEVLKNHPNAGILWAHATTPIREDEGGVNIIYGK